MEHHFDALNFAPFSGEGNRLDGKKKRLDKVETPTSVKVIEIFNMWLVNICKKFVFIFQEHARGIPDYDHPYGLIRFDRSVKPNSTSTTEDGTDVSKPGNTNAADDFQAFQGAGFSLKKGRK